MIRLDRCRSIPTLVAAALTVSLAAALGACAAPASTATPSEPQTSGPATAEPGPTIEPTPEPTLSPSAGSPATPTPPETPEPTSPSGGLPMDRFTLSLSPFAQGLDSPVFATHAGDGSGQFFVVEQGGRIVTVDRSGIVADDPFLDITERVVAGGEQGLLGLAFHPDFPDDDRFFVMYTAADEGQNTVSEFHAPGGVGDPTSERVLLSIADFAGNHNGGMVAFGADGYLYAGTGDGGGGGDPRDNGQDPHALLGKILRIDVDSGDPYAIPADNPSQQGADLAPEVWALGLRNPWRFSFDRESADLWIGDVGQGSWEEIDVQRPGEAGLNYGWNTMEGPACFAVEACDQEGLTLPVAAYEHFEGACTVIGGYVYRGAAVPGAHGLFLFGDYCSGQIWGLDASAALAQGTAEAVELLSSDAILSSFGEDEEGELYALDLAGSMMRVDISLRD